MRILFIENKHNTRTWETLTPLLERAGDEVHWLVQNQRWIPRAGEVHFIPPPRADQYATPEPGRFDQIRDQDRGINYFGGDDRHYPYYAARIAEVIAAVAPDVVIGETTLFHELLALQACREQGVPYLFPITVRYPVDRIGFYAGDTQEVVAESGDIAAEAEIDRLLEIYERRGQVPLFYTQLDANGFVTRIRHLFRALGKGVLAVRSRLGGEQFNTPAPLHKARIERRKNSLIAQWNRLSETKAHVAGRTTVLFPLQMLPESTLECWGYEWRDQLDVLRRLVEASDADTVFQVKTNPMPRYEISPELLDFVSNHPRVRPLASSTSMDEVFWQADLIATVTGSVAIEAFLTGRPFVTLSYSLATRFAPGGTLIRPENLSAIITAIRDGTWPVADEATKRRFLAHQIAISHPGIIIDYYYFPPVLADENIHRLAAAMAHVRTAVREGRLKEEVRAAEARAL